jgi:hypothetical protein
MFSQGVVQNYSELQADLLYYLYYGTFQNFIVQFSSKIGKLDNVKYSNPALSLYGDCYTYEKSI